MTQEEYLRLNPRAATPTYHGRQADKGRILVGKSFPREGYAVLRCGNTEVQISYSVLHNTMLSIDPDSHAFTDLVALQKALHSIMCEASLGRTGD